MLTPERRTQRRSAWRGASGAAIYRRADCRVEQTATPAQELRRACRRQSIAALTAAWSKVAVIEGTAVPRQAAMAEAAAAQTAGALPSNAQPFIEPTVEATLWQASHPHRSRHTQSRWRARRHTIAPPFRSRRGPGRHQTSATCSRSACRSDVPVSCLSPRRATPPPPLRRPVGGGPPSAPVARDVRDQRSPSVSPRRTGSRSMTQALSPPRSVTVGRS